MCLREGLANTPHLYAEVVIDTDPVEFEWSVNKPEFASVDANGLLTSISEGVVVVTASNKDSTGISGEISVTVTIDHTIVDQANSAQMRIYPNPADDLIHIENASDIQKVTIINSGGQIVMEISNTEAHISLNIESLQSGIYLMRLDSKEGGPNSYSFIKK